MNIFVFLNLSFWNPPEGSFPFTSHFLSPGLLRLSFCLYFLFAFIWFQQFRDVRGLSSKRSLHMSPIGGVWLGACPKLTELCLFLPLALILPPARGPGGRERAAGKQPAALQLIISPNLHLLQAVRRILPLRPTANITQSYSVFSAINPVSHPLSLRLAPAGGSRPLPSSPTYPLAVWERVCERLWHAGTSLGIWHILTGGEMGRQTP